MTMSGFDSPTVPDDALFVDDGASLLVFPSVDAAEAALDPGDVESGSYVAAYGPRGEPYRISCEARQVRFSAAGGPNEPDQLKDLLLRYCEDCEDPDDATRPLEALVAHAWSIERDHWSRCGEEASGGNLALMLTIAFAVALGLLLNFAFR